LLVNKTKLRVFLLNDKRALSLLLVPALLLFVMFVIVPILLGFNISFTNWNGYSQKYKFIGFKNYLDLFTNDSVKVAFKNTLLYGFGSTFIQTILGLAFAMLLCKKFLLRTVTRTIIYIPAMVSQLVIGYIWYFLVSYERGGINDIVLLFGGQKVDWLSNGNRAVFIILLINAIEYCGKTMIIFIAGLESIPNMYHEAAEIDGASEWMIFRHISIPLLLPAFTTTLVLNIIGGLKMFGLIIALTDGGPGYSTHSLSSLINGMYFANQRAGFSSAIGIFSFIFILLVNALLRKFLENRERSYNE
jgi:raffinose/stachyose/melibiose transport system permease protein